MQHKPERLQIFNAVLEFSRFSETLSACPRDYRRGTFAARQARQFHPMAPEPAADRPNVQPGNIAKAADTETLQH